MSADQTAAFEVTVVKRGYRSPSGPRSPFLQRKFWQVHISPVEPHIKGGRRKWFSTDHRAENRDFAVYYGFNPRCHHQGSWGKPGTFHWRRDR